MTKTAESAISYFEAFHAGRINEVLSYFSAMGVVKYGTEPAKPATEFFPATREMIAQIKFKTHGVYTTSASASVIIYFSFTMPTENGDCHTTEAVDIIEFDDNGKITSVKVIPNG